MKICIDTNIYSSLMRGDAETIDILEMADEIRIPSIVLGELYAGFQMGKHYDKNIHELNLFLEKPGVEIIDVDIEISQRYGYLVKTLKKQGTPIPTNDVWIAAVAFETGSKLYTRDSHFGNVPGLFIL